MTGKPNSGWFATRFVTKHILTNGASGTVLVHRASASPIELIGSVHRPEELSWTCSTTPLLEGPAEYVPVRPVRSAIDHLRSARGGLVNGLPDQGLPCLYFLPYVTSGLHRHRLVDLAADWGLLNDLPQKVGLPRVQWLSPPAWPCSACHCRHLRMCSNMLVFLADQGIARDGRSAMITAPPNSSPLSTSPYPCSVPPHSLPPLSPPSTVSRFSISPT